MAKQTLNLGSAADDGTGTTLREGGDIINDNFDEIYADLGDGTNLGIASKTETLTNKTITTEANTITSGGNTVCSLQQVYPVGSVYINASVATNPGTLLGFGTWAAFGAGRVPVGIDSSDSDFDTAEETGGAKTDSHTLTIAEMPSHNHPRATSTSDDFGAGGTHGYIGGDQASSNVDTSMALQGGGQAHTHDIVQPYIVVYMWKRTA
jgi:hypothetical protein